MKLTIGEALTPLVIPNSYSVEVKVMAGDADYYDSFTVHGFEPGRDEELLEELLRLFDRVDAFYPHGRGGGSEYTLRKVPGFNSWFTDDDSFDYADEYEAKVRYASEEERARYAALGKRVAEFKERVDERAKALKLSGVSFPYWPMDATTDYAIECDHELHRVYFYDENLVKHDVTVEL